MTKIDTLDPFMREKVAEFADIPSRLQLACVSKDWKDAVDHSWGPRVYGLPFVHCRPLDAPAWKKACRLPDMAARLRPPVRSEELEPDDAEMILTTAQLEGRAGKPSGEHFILKKLVQLGHYDDALRYMQTYPADAAGTEAEPTNSADEGPLDTRMRRASAMAILQYLLGHACPSPHLKTLIDACLSLHDAAFSRDYAELAAKMPNAAVSQAMAGDSFNHIDIVYAGIRGALARGHVAKLKAYLDIYHALGRPAIGPLLDVAMGDDMRWQMMRTLFDAGLTGAPCALPSAPVIGLLFPNIDTARAARFRTLFHNAKGDDGATWLHKLAARNDAGAWAVVGNLCKTGMSIFESDAHGVTALGVAEARVSGHWTLPKIIDLAPTPWPPGFEQLRTGSIDEAYAFWNAELTQRPQRAVELLRCASWAGDLACVGLALTQEAAVRDMHAALLCASAKGHGHVMQLLVESFGQAVPFDFDVTLLPAEFIRAYCASNLVLSDVLQRELNEAQLRRLCAAHTARAPLVDREGMSLPVALIRENKIHGTRQFWTRNGEAPLGAQEIITEMIRNPVDAYNEHGILLEAAYKWAPLAPDMCVPYDSALLWADRRYLNILETLNLAWLGSGLSHEEGHPMSALAWAMVYDLKSNSTYDMTKNLAQRGLRLLECEKPIFKQWVEHILKQDHLFRQMHAIIDGLVRGGLSPNIRDSRGRTLLHRCAHGDVYDSLVANGADPFALDFRGQTAARPDALLY